MAESGVITIFVVYRSSNTLEKEQFKQELEKISGEKEQIAREKEHIAMENELLKKNLEHSKSKFPS